MILGMSMKTIRNNIFETNSSSVHAIVISTKQKSLSIYNDPLPYKVIYKGEIFAGRVDIINSFTQKIIYFHIACTDSYDTDKLKKFTEYLKKRNITIENIDSDIYRSRIDHPEELEYFTELLLDNEKLLDNFIFNTESKIYTSMDSDDESIAVKISDAINTDCKYHGSFGLIRIGKKKPLKYVYIKGN